MLHDPGMGNPHITEMPGLMPDARHLFPPPGVTLDKSVFCRFPAESAANPRIGKLRPDKVDFLLLLPQVNGKPALMLAVSGIGHIGFRKFPSVFLKRVLPDFLLLPAGAPAADRYDSPPAVYFIHQMKKKHGRPALHENPGFLLQNRKQGCALILLFISICPVYQDQTAGINPASLQNNLFHAHLPVPPIGR